MNEMTDEELDAAYEAAAYETVGSFHKWAREHFPDYQDLGDDEYDALLERWSELHG